MTNRSPGGRHRIAPPHALPLLLAAGSLLLAGCGGAAGTTPDAGATGAASSAAPATLTVFAAASLTATFSEMEPIWEAAHPGTDLQFSFAGSSDLVSQLTAGAPADVLATADQRTMTQATDASLVADPVTFATNTLQILVAPGNPKGITGAEDLTSDDVVTVICAAQVPCGAATKTAFDDAGITLKPASEENAVTDVVGKVTSGEADAGVVYATDVASAVSKGTGEGVDLGLTTKPNTYPIGVVAESDSPDLAADFVDFVTGTEGQAILSKAGFGAP